MRPTIIILMAFLTLHIHSLAQADYKTSIGARVAPASGITLKHFITERASLEGIFATRWRGLNFTGLYEISQNAFRTERINFYYGAGAHVGFWEDSSGHPWFDDEKDNLVVGIDGIIGLEYTFRSIPFNISLDWKPAFNLISYMGLWADEVGFSLRYYW